MTDFFQCPECHAVHTAPLSADFTLSVPCASCELTAAIEAANCAPVALALAA